MLRSNAGALKVGQLPQGTKLRVSGERSEIKVLHTHKLLRHLLLKHCPEMAATWKVRTVYKVTFLIANERQPQLVHVRARARICVFTPHNRPETVYCFQRSHPHLLPPRLLLLRCPPQVVMAPEAVGDSILGHEGWVSLGMAC